MKLLRVWTVVSTQRALLHQLLSASVPYGLGHCLGVNAGAGLGEEGVQPLSPDMAFPSQGACFFPLNPFPDP